MKVHLGLYCTLLMMPPAQVSFFLLLPASSGYSVCALLLLRDTIMLYKALLTPHFYIVHIKPINLRPV